MSAYYRKAWKSEDFHPGQNIFKPSGVTDTFVPPASFSLHLKYIQALWIWVKYVYPKIQGKSLLYGIKNVQKIYNHLVRLLTPVRIASLRRVEGFFPLSLSLSLSLFFLSSFAGPKMTYCFNRPIVVHIFAGVQTPWMARTMAGTATIGRKSEGLERGTTEGWRDDDRAAGRFQ